MWETGCLHSFLGPTVLARVFPRSRGSGPRVPQRSDVFYLPVFRTSLSFSRHIFVPLSQSLRWPRFATLVSVDAVTRIGPALLTLVSLLAPAMACALPASGMTASERACCKQMRGRCGAASMPASHSCCRASSELHQVDGTQPQAHWTPPDLAMVPSLAVSCAALLLPAIENVSTPWHYHPPPLSLSTGTTVLRI